MNCLASADLVQRLDRFGGDPGVAVEGGQDPGADLDPRCGGREGPCHRDALPEPLRRSLGGPPQQLIGHPDRVETDLLGAEGEVPDLDPTRRGTLDEVVPRRVAPSRSRTFSLDLRVGELRPAGRRPSGPPFPRRPALPPLVDHARRAIMRAALRTTPCEPGLGASWPGMRHRGAARRVRVHRGRPRGVAGRLCRLRAVPTDGRR